MRSGERERRRSRKGGRREEADGAAIAARGTTQSVFQDVGQPEPLCVRCSVEVVVTLLGGSRYAVGQTRNGQVVITVLPGKSTEDWF